MPSFSIHLKPIKTPLHRARHHHTHPYIPRTLPDGQLYTIEIATVAASTASVLTALWFQQQWQRHSNHLNTTTNNINASDNNDIFNSSIQTSSITDSPWDSAWQALTSTSSTSSSQNTSSPPPPLTTPLFMLQAIKLSHRMHLITLSLKSLQQSIQDINTNTASDDVQGIIAACARQVASQFTNRTNNSDRSGLLDALDNSILNDSSTWWPPLKERSTPYTEAVQICRRRYTNSDGSSAFDSSNTTTFIQDEHCDLVLLDMAIMVAELVAAAIVTQSLPISSTSSSTAAAAAALVVKKNGKKNSTISGTNNVSNSQGMQTSLRVVKRQFSNTRALQRFANQIILCRWVESTFASVVNIVEDRLVLYKILRFGSGRNSKNNGVLVANNDDNNNNISSSSSSSTVAVPKQGGGLLSTVAVPMKRTEELRNLTGLRFTVSLFLEASDLLSPLLNAFWRSALAGGAWLLVQFVGRALGLIWKGIKLSFDTGNSKGRNTTTTTTTTTKKSRRANRKGGGDDEYGEEGGSQLPPSVWGGGEGGGGMWSPVY